LKTHLFKLTCCNERLSIFGPEGALQMRYIIIITFVA